MRVHVHTGTGALAQLGTALDDLQEACSAPVTARRPWLQSWVDCYTSQDPWCVVVEDGGGGLAAAALLARRRRLGVTGVVAIGSGPSDQLRLLARDGAAGEALAGAVAGQLRRLAGPWTLTVPQLPVTEPAALALVRRLPYAEMIAAEDSPTTRFGEERSLRRYVSRNHHQQVRRLHNRMRREVGEPAIDVLTEPDEIARVLPEVERVCRARDAEVYRPTKLDHPEDGPFFRDVVMRHAAREEVELVTLRLAGTLAAYVLSFLDGPAYRMWHCRFDPRFGHLGPGRVALNGAMARAVDNGRYQEFDWMRGEETYKYSLSNGAVPARDLLAGSSLALRDLARAPYRGKALLKPLMARYPTVKRVVYAAATRDPGALRARA